MVTDYSGAIEKEIFQNSVLNASQRRSYSDWVMDDQ